MEESAALAAGLPPWLALKVMPAVACPPHLWVGASTCHAKSVTTGGAATGGFDLIEANEAFAAQFLAVGKTWALILRK